MLTNINFWLVFIMDFSANGGEWDGGGKVLKNPFLCLWKMCFMGLGTGFFSLDQINYCMYFFKRISTLIFFTHSFWYVNSLCNFLPGFPYLSSVMPERARSASLENLGSIGGLELIRWIYQPDKFPYEIWFTEKYTSANDREGMILALAANKWQKPLV